MGGGKSMDIWGMKGGGFITAPGIAALVKGTGDRGIECLLEATGN